jgi:hypothetical protein
MTDRARPKSVDSSLARGLAHHGHRIMLPQAAPILNAIGTRIMELPERCSPKRAARALRDVRRALPKSTAIVDYGADTPGFVFTFALSIPGKQWHLISGWVDYEAKRVWWDLRDVCVVLSAHAAQRMIQTAGIISFSELVQSEIAPELMALVYGDDECVPTENGLLMLRSTGEPDAVVATTWIAADHLNQSKQHMRDSWFDEHLRRFDAERAERDE